MSVLAGALCAQHGAAAKATCSRCGVFVCGSCETYDAERNASYCPPCAKRMVQPLIRPSGRAYAAIIVGVAGLHCMFPLGIVALGLASAELSDIEAGAAPEAGRDYVRWAKTIGWINVALTVISVAIGGMIAIGMSMR